MTHSGKLYMGVSVWLVLVLIPLLLDDPLWALPTSRTCILTYVLIPLLLDDPLWVTLRRKERIHSITVLIPLLLDDPLWGCVKRWTSHDAIVLIPLLLDDPLWEFPLQLIH